MRRRRREESRGPTGEDALGSGDARYRAIVEHSVDGIFLTRQDGSILSANPAACRMLGRTEEEIIRLGRAGVMDTDDPRLAEAIEERRRKGYARVELTCVRSDGSKFPVELTSSLFIDADGLEKTSLSFRDLTERKRAEERLRLIGEAGAVLGTMLESEGTFKDLTRLVVPRLADCCVVDLLQDGQLRRVAASHRDPTREPSLLAVRRQGTGEGLARGVVAVARTGEAELVPVVDDEWLRASTADAAQLSAVRAMGLRSLVLVPLARKGNVLGVLTLALLQGGAESRSYDASDLSAARAIADRAALAIENARLFEQILQAKRLRDDVLGLVSHDLRGPLHAIALNTHALIRKGDSAELRAIERAVKRAGSLIDDLLTAASLESGAMPLLKRLESVGTLVDEAVLLQQAAAGERRLEVRASVPTDLPPVPLDRHRILQVLTNLLGNAVQFSPPGATVRIDVAVREGALVASVSNTGRGIEGEHLGKVFDRFWQGARERRAGAGLGLAIAKGIVEAHGGTIRAESVPGALTTFTFTLPLGPAPRP